MTPFQPPHLIGTHGCPASCWSRGGLGLRLGFRRKLHRCLGAEERRVAAQRHRSEAQNQSKSGHAKGNEREGGLAHGLAFFTVDVGSTWTWRAFEAFRVFKRVFTHARQLESYPIHGSGRMCSQPRRVEDSQFVVSPSTTIMWHLLESNEGQSRRF